MNRDFKIGAAVGLCLIAGALLWLAVQPSLSVKARMTEQEVIEQPAPPPRDSTPASQHPPPTTASHQQTYRIHIVQRGDTLSGISQQYYGSSGKWQKILDANRDTLKNPNNLTPGSKLIIPD